MQLRIVAVGKVREPYVQQACADFRDRLVHYVRLELREVRASQLRYPAAAIAEEGPRLLEAIGGSDHVWLLDREGTQIDSFGLHREMQHLQETGAIWTLILGGAFGVSRDVYRRANFVWSLSRLTFLHEWARAVVLEQIYRAAKIGRNEPYHH